MFAHGLVLSNSSLPPLVKGVGSGRAGYLMAQHQFPLKEQKKGTFVRNRESQGILCAMSYGILLHLVSGQWKVKGRESFHLSLAWPGKGDSVERDAGDWFSPESTAAGEVRGKNSP